MNINNIIHRFIKTVGGYWPVHAALARLIEEISELNNAMTSQSIQKIQEELIDIITITACISNQYCIPIELNYSKRGSPASSNALTLSIIIRESGQLARQINCIEGIKPLKQHETLGNISDTINEIVNAAATLLSGMGIDVIKQLSEASAKKSARDKNRFALRHDPTMCDVLDEFRIIQSRTLCPFSAGATLWGSRKWDNKWSFERNAINVSEDIKRFATVNKHVNIDGFVVQFPTQREPANIDLLKHTFRNILTFIVEYDGDTIQYDKVNDPKWQFTFFGLRMFVIVFSKIYGENHPRRTYGIDSNYILFQPEKSFEIRKNSYQGARRLEDGVQGLFESEGYIYFPKIMKSATEAERYIKPMDQDIPVLWWDYE